MYDRSHRLRPAATSSACRGRPSCWDPDSECTIVFAQPAIERELWTDYVRGACHSYRKHGVEKALDMDALRNGADTITFRSVRRMTRVGSSRVCGQRAHISQPMNATHFLNGVGSPVRMLCGKWSPIDCRLALWR